MRVIKPQKLSSPFFASEKLSFSNEVLNHHKNIEPHKGHTFAFYAQGRIIIPYEEKSPQRAK